MRIWSKFQPARTPVWPKRMAKNARLTTYQRASIPTRKKKSSRNSMARLKENRRK
jgi:hypothetical protein